MARNGDCCHQPSIMMQPMDLGGKEVLVSADESVQLVTPLPRQQFFLIWIIHASQGFQTTMLFPMLVFMVEKYGVAGKDGRDIGFYAGLLASLFPLAQFCSSMPWGIISDRTGRRPWLASGNTVSAISSLLMGLSQSYPNACMVRFLGGLLNGTMTITKSTVAELCDGTNQAKGFGILNLAWGIGAIAGPIVSGLLAQPCVQYKSPKCPQFLQTHPFLLPCFSATLFSTAAVCAAVNLKETNPCVNTRKQPYNKISTEGLGGTRNSSHNETAPCESQEREMHSFNSTSFDGGMVDMNLHESSSANASCKQKLMVVISSMEEIANNDHGDVTATQALSPSDLPKYSSEETSGPQKAVEPPSTMTLLRDREVLLSSFCYSMTGLIFIITDELFPMFGASSTAVGGLGFSSSKLGLVLGEGGLVLCIFTLLLYPRVAKRLGPLYCFRYGILASVPLWILFPACSLLSARPTFQWILLLFTMAIRSVVACTTFTGVLILVSNSASSANVGTVTGLSHSFCSFFRAIGPALGGIIWSFGSTKHFPFHQFLAWQFVVLLSLCTFGLSYTLPPSLVQPKEKR